MLDFLASTSSQNSNDSDLYKEIQSYFDAPNEESECLEWWEKNKEVTFYVLLRILVW